MQITVERTTLEELFQHAVAAAHLVGHIDDPRILVLGDHIDTVAQGLSELLGRSAQGGAPDVRTAHDGTLTLMSGVGGTP